ncbi:MAG: hypothetical protein J6Z14_04395 [Prevotella sp.]|nr:hypothetical protein [Prevotella sp.]
MKKMMFMAMMTVMTVTTNAMSYTAVKNEALFLSDKMAYELNLTDAQYDAVYEINLDYLMSVNGRNDVLGPRWDRRNADLMYVLTAYQYNKYVGLTYFYRPLSWNNGGWTFNVYTHYTNRNKFYKARPTVYVSYKGGNNHKPATHYADRGLNKPSVHHGNTTAHNDNPADHNDNKTWRNTSGHGNNASNRQIAQNTHTNRNSSSGHFGSRR